MAFIFPELVIESVLRDGFKNARRDESIIDDVFAELTKPFAASKYGTEELEKIKKIVKEDVAIVHSFHDINKRTPCVSIQLIDNSEMEDLARMDDFEDDVRFEITDPAELADLIEVDTVIPTAYDSKTGKVSVDDSVDLSQVHINLLYEDDQNNEFKIVGGISNTTGQKSFLLKKGSDVSIAGNGLIKSSLNFKQYEKRGTTENEAVMLGIHTKEPLLTKYLYILVKYFILSRKADLIKRCFTLSTFSGSDFSRLMSQEADHVYTRFMTVKGRMENSWTSDKVDLVDEINVNVLVEKDVAGEECFEDSSVKPTED